MIQDTYVVTILKDSNIKALTIYANDSNHAVAQAEDISRALGADKFQINYGNTKESTLSKLFKDLALNNFNHKDCYEWESSYSNRNPCVYIFKKRLYTRNVILKYLDIPKDEAVVKLTCNNSKCVNPYHFSYLTGKNSKITGGDLGLAVAYLSRGVSIAQIAKALNVHRSTIYRNLKHECLHPRSTRN